MFKQSLSMAASDIVTASLWQARYNPAKRQIAKKQSVFISSRGLAAVAANFVITSLFLRSDALE